MKLDFNPVNSVFFFESTEPSSAKIFGAKKVWIAANKAVWTMPSMYPQGLMALRDFKAIFPEAKASGEALNVIKRLKGIYDGIGDHTLINESGYVFLNPPPYIHQLNTIEVMLNSNVCALLIDLGLGKTAITLLYLAIKSLTMQVKALILCPKIMTLNWVYESEKFTPNLTHLIYEGTKTKRKKIQDKLSSQSVNFIVTNYEAIGKKNSDDYTFFKDQDFNVLIVDEASRLKSHDSQRSIAIDALAQDIPNKFILSGGLTLGSPLDLYTPFHVLDGNILGNNYWAYKNKYVKVAPWNKHITIGFKNLDILKAKVTPFSVILNKDDVLSLPDRNFVVRYVPMTPTQWDFYNTIAIEDSINVEGREIITNLAILKLTKALQVVSGFINFSVERNYKKCNKCQYIKECVELDIYPWNSKVCRDFDPSITKPKVETHSLFPDTVFQPKLAMLREDIQTIEERGEHCIIWVYFRWDFQEIKEALELDGTTFVTSDEPGSDRIYEQGKHTVYLGRVAQGIGITLNKASITIYYSHSMHSEHRMQSLDRCYRIGQTKKTTVIDYVCRGTVEEQVLTLLQQKRNIRDYIHNKTECKKCDKFIWCFERLIVPYSTKCKLYEIRENAERIQHIQIGK